MCLGAQYNEKGDYERAAPFLEGAGALSHNRGQAKHDRRPPQPRGRGAPEGNYKRAKRLNMESIALAREIEDTWGASPRCGMVGIAGDF